MLQTGNLAVSNVDNSRLRMIKRRDNPLVKTISLSSIMEFTHKVSLIMIRYKIKYETFRDLMTVVELYSKYQVPVSQHQVAKYSELHNKNYRMVIARLQSLREKGLVEVAGVAMNNGKLLVPSVKALEELAELCK